jgi:predicted small metal-binding protein
MVPTGLVLHVPSLFLLKAIIILFSEGFVLITLTQGDPKEVFKMEKSLSCRDVGADCDFVACGKTEEEIFQKAAAHARTAHNMSEIPKDLYDKARSAIREVNKC